MNTSSIEFRTLTYRQPKTYAAAALFVLGNIALPQLCHLLPQGGATLLPIYFFTLVGAYRYGWKVGLLTALLSPLANAALFGMPAVAALPAILAKSTLLALIAGYAAARYRRASLALVASVVLLYQLAGTAVEWAMTGSLRAALQDFRIGTPGMLLQIFGGWAAINFLERK